ncbi:hypothetical protein AB0I53_29475 [Saccharopolyspora sp. NPDC050389]|uniref:hypothetical protein n=1 Tax=Saccharopolyspora sp. NPDC050389 TaxID=3155516 RepID=UPI003401E7AB
MPTSTVSTTTPIHGHKAPGWFVATLMNRATADVTTAVISGLATGRIRRIGLGVRITTPRTIADPC